MLLSRFLISRRYHEIINNNIPSIVGIHIMIPCLFILRLSVISIFKNMCHRSKVRESIVSRPWVVSLSFRGEVAKKSKGV